MQSLYRLRKTQHHVVCIVIQNPRHLVYKTPSAYLLRYLPASVFILLLLREANIRAFSQKPSLADSVLRWYYLDWGGIHSWMNVIEFSLLFWV